MSDALKRARAAAAKVTGVQKGQPEQGQVTDAFIADTNTPMEGTVSIAGLAPGDSISIHRSQPGATAEVSAEGESAPTTQVAEPVVEPMEPMEPATPMAEKTHAAHLAEFRALLPPGATLDEYTHTYHLAGDWFAQDYEETDGTMKLKGDPMKIESSAPVAQPEPPAADPMTQPAPDALAGEFNLPKGSTVNECFAALRKDRDGAIGNRAEALAQANVKPDLADLAETCLVRGTGQTWEQAVAGLKSARPSLFVEEQPAQEKPADDNTTAPAEKREPASVTPAAKLPAGAQLTPNTTPAGVKGGRKDAVQSHADRIAASYGNH